MLQNCLHATTSGAENPALSLYLVKCDAILLELGIDIEVVLLQEVVDSQIGYILTTTISDEFPKEVETRKIHTFHSLF
jgi:hypothetical protein